MYTLYYSPGSASMAVHLNLIELDAPHTLHLLDFASKQQREASYLKLNPGGVVPTLVCDDGQALVETGALLLNLAERHPMAALAPLAGEAERAKWIEWIVYLNANLGSAFRLWFYPAELGAEAGVEVHSAAIEAALRSRIEAIWERIALHLESNGPYLLGQRFSSADLMLTMYMRWSRKMPRTALDWPALARTAAQVKARPSWHQLYQAEGLTEW
jgi:glutathione S-transferase